MKNSQDFERKLPSGATEKRLNGSYELSNPPKLIPGLDDDQLARLRQPVFTTLTPVETEDGLEAQVTRGCINRKHLAKVLAARAALGK